jgi:hypothetical protein
MSEAAVMSHRQARSPLDAAKSGASMGAALACVLLLAAACEPLGQDRVLPIIAGFSGGSGVVAGNGGVAGMAGPPPGTAGRPPTGAGTGIPVGGGAAGIPGPGSMAGTVSVPTAGTAGGGTVTPPNPDGGLLPPFNPGVAPNRNQVRAGQVCSRIAGLQCAAELHCCAAPAKGLDACQTQLTMACKTGAYLDDISNNSVSGYSVPQIEAVLNKLEEYATACDPSIPMWAATPEGLRSIFQGTVAPNAMCKPTGLPSPSNYAAALASCTQPATHACLFTGDGPNAPPQTATCSARLDAGATCFVDTNCKDGLYCANPQMKYSGGKCTALKEVGATCTLDTECATFTCRSAACVMPTVQTAYCVST